MKKICEQEAASLGLISKGWRDVPVNEAVLGKLARENEPFITQWIVNVKDKEINLEALLFRLKQRISNRANIELKEDKLGLYICSLSNKTIVYKGMVRSEILAPFYTDLKDKRFEVSFAVYHRRFSTNTLPKWPLAQPMRLLGHNGEINTLLGNINWAKATETGRFKLPWLSSNIFFASSRLADGFAVTWNPRLMKAPREATELACADISSLG